MFDPAKYFGGHEVDKCRDRLAFYCRGMGLDIGCGGFSPDGHYRSENKIVDSAIGVDLARTNLSGSANSLYWFTDECLDYIFSSHLLEHLSDPLVALSEWLRVLKPDGLIVLYLPLDGCYPSVGEPGANMDHKHNLTPLTILKWLNKIHVPFDVIRIEERRDGDEYSFDFVIRKRILTR